MRSFFKIVLCLLLIISFFRAVNGASFVGAADIVFRLQEFEFDLTPINELVAIWSEDGRMELSPFDEGRFLGAFGSIIGVQRPAGVELNFLEEIYYFMADLGYSLLETIYALGETLIFIFTDGFSLVTMSVEIFVQTWDFALWILGFS